MDYGVEIFQVHIRIQEAKKCKQHHIKKANVNFFQLIFASRSVSVNLHWQNKTMQTMTWKFLLLDLIKIAHHEIIQKYYSFFGRTRWEFYFQRGLIARSAP